MHVCFLGTGSGRPLVDRFGQTVVVTTQADADEPNHYLLDTGDGASSLLLRHGFDHTRIRAIIISHMHADHHGGFAQVVKTCMHLKRSTELLVLAPMEGIPTLQRYLEASYLIEPMLGYPIQWVPLSQAIAKPVNVQGNMTIRAHANSHLDSARQRLAELNIDDHGYTFESYSVALDAESARIVYSGNLNGARGTDELMPFLEPCDLLICELAHVDPAELGRVLATKKVGKTALAHFHPKWQGVSDIDILNQIEEGAGSRNHLGEIILTRDGDRLTCLAAGSQN